MRVPKLQQVAVAALEDIKARDIAVFDVRQQTSLYDTLVIASADSNRQVKALANHVRDRLIHWRNECMVGYAPTQATRAAFGSGCGAAGRIAWLETFGPPRLGSSAFSLDLLGPPGASPSLLALGFASGASSLGHGCTVLVPNAAAVAFSMQSPDGFGRWPLPLPVAQSLRGVALFAQGATLDPQAPLGLTLTQGIQLTLDN